MTRSFVVAEKKVHGSVNVRRNDAMLYECVVGLMMEIID